MIAALKQPFFILVFLVLSATGLRAQQNHFIYLQADNKQPFYVKLQSQVWSSTASGYLILAKLPEGKHELKIGFPRNEWPEQSFTCTIAKKDLGFAVKNLGQKGWGMLNLQTGDILMPVGKEPAAKAKTFEVSDDNFSNLLAEVVDDPAIRQTSVEGETVLIAQNAVVRSASISKVGESDNKNGHQATYIDKEDGQADTVQVLIPAALQLNTVVATSTKDNPVTRNISCKKIATDNEVILLKKKVYTEKTEEDKLAVVTKAIKSKCFTTAQVMELASLFPGDAGRYKLFNATYAHTSDKERYAMLKSQLKDERYINLFNAML